MDLKEKVTRIWNSVFVPTSIKPIRIVLLLENILCLYRNLDYYKNKFRSLIYLRIAVETTLTITCITSYSMHILNYPMKSNMEVIYFYMNSVTAVVIILLACYHSRNFKKLLLIIESNDLYFANDEKYQKNMKRQDYIIKWGLLICSMLLVIVGLLKYNIRKSPTLMPTMIPHLLFSLNSKYCNCRSIYEYIVLYGILYVMSQQVECITRAVSKKRISVATVKEQWDSDEDSSEIRLEKKEFDELSTAFSNIKVCSKLFNKIYGLQLVFMLGSATAYCIMFLYTMAFLSVKGYKDINSLISNVMKLLIFFLLLLLLSYSAQKKQNNLKNLRRQLGKLLINCANDDAHYKATKDFLRLVSTTCIKTETLGAIDVDMSLIPSFIMFITSYTVIALQFNNIV